jgi:subtilase family serine protease
MANSTASGTVSLPGGLTPGVFYVGSVVDDTNNVDELDESNNSSNSMPITITAAGPQPDLELTSFNGPVGSVAAGGLATASAVTTNIGTADAGGFAVGIYLSTNSTISASGDTFLGNCTATGLATSGTFSCVGDVTIPGSLVAGTYYLGAVADDLLEVSESDETNNASASLAIVITSGGADQPDLELTSFTAPSSGTAGGTVDIVSQITNIGAADAGTHQVGVYLSSNDLITTIDTLIGFCIEPNGLVAGATGTCGGSITLPASLTAGTYYLGAIADDLGQVGESDESNNTLVGLPIVITVGAALPDLELTSFTAPSSGTAGGTVFLDAQVTNISAADAGAYQVGYYLSSNDLITTGDTHFAFCDETTGLVAGATTGCVGPVPLPASLTAGTYYLGAIVDDLGQVGESDESNNTLVGLPIVITVGATLPDLELTSFSGSNSGTAGGAFNFDARVTNIGAADAGAYQVGIYLSSNDLITTSDTFIAFCDETTGLVAGATRGCVGPLPLPTSLTAGTYYLGAIADDLGQVGESDESNNTLVGLPIVITAGGTALPDLELTSISGPSSASAGGLAFVSAVTTNIGSVDAGAFDVAVYLSTNNIISNGDTQLGTCSPTALIAGGIHICSGNVTIPTGLAIGTYYLGAIADDLGQVGESDENNNFRVGATIAITGGGAAAADAYEPDDTPAVASFYAGPQNHNHEDDADDYVVFSAVAGVTYTIATSNLSASEDTFLYLFGTDGVTQLDLDDDGGAELFASEIVWNCPVSGSYYVNASTFGGFGVGRTYTLTIL